MMRNKFLALALSITFVTTSISYAYASESQTDKPIETKEISEMREYIFDVVKVEESTVELMYNGERTKDAIIFEDILGDSNITLDKGLLDKNVDVKDRYILKTKDRIWAIDSNKIKKDDLSLDKKYEKPTNMDINDIQKDATVKDFLIESIDKDKLNPTAVLREAGSLGNKYTIGLDRLPDENPMVGYMYKIYWDGISLSSYPAQFGKIYRVEKVLLSTLEENNEDDKKVEKREFEVTEVHESELTLAEVQNKDNLYSISFKDLGDDTAVVGDRYKITWSGNSTRSYPAKFIDIVDVEKWMKKDAKASQVNMDKLDKALERAEEILNGTTTYNKATATKFIDSLNYAAEIKEKNPSQEEIDKASKDLNDAIDGLSEKDKVLTFTFEIAEIVDKGGKKARFRSVDDKDWDFLYNYDSLNDKDAKVGDRYHIDFDGMEVARNTSKYGDILSINKIDNQKENSTVDKKPIKEEDKASEKKEEVKKDEAKKEEKKIGFGNPSTGISSVMPVVGIAGLATVGYLASRKKK